MTISSFSPRVPGSVAVLRFMCRSNRREPISGNAAERWNPSVKTSPVWISFAALSAISGFIKLPEPISSFAPHFEGQRCASLGISHDCARAIVHANPYISARTITRAGHIVRIFVPPDEQLEIGQGYRLKPMRVASNYKGGGGVSTRCG